MWGLNRNGQTGTGVKAESILEPRPVDRTDIGRKVPSQLVCGRNHTCLLTTEGRVYSWGAAGFGRLGVMDSRKIQHTPREVQQFRNITCQYIAAGDFHTLAIDSEGAVFSWGYGLEGQCGNGSTMNVRTPRQIVFPDEDVEIQDLTCGSSWSFALTTTGALYTWGYGDGGWLGICPPAELPYVESEQPPPPVPRGSDYKKSSYYYNVYTRSFDSTLNVLRPTPVAMAADRYVKWTRCGAGHAIFC
ncbi:Rcbtb2, partial [Symbiodinium microadriaticum]